MSAGAFVCRRQVHVAGNGVAEAPEQDFTEYLGHDIGELVLRDDREDFDRSVLDMIAQEVVPDVDVLGPLHCGSVLGDLDTGAIVFVDNARLLNIDAHGA